MRLLPSLALALLAASATWALPTLPVTFQDELDSQNPNDVIGDPAYFEIDNLKLVGMTGNTLQVDIRFNYGGGAALSPFAINGFNPMLRVGDLFLNTTAGSYAYILSAHDGLSANGLYKITGTQSAASVLGSPTGSYRPDAQVWASANGAQWVAAGTNTVTTVGGVSTQLLAGILLPLDPMGAASLANGFSVYFASATCGNDEITGTVPATGIPEPGTWALFGAGLTALGLIRRNR